MPIGLKHVDFAKNVMQMLKQNNIRVDLYDEDTISKRIRNAEMQKIPYIAIIGDKEISADSVALRERGKGDTGQIKIQDFIDRLMHEANTKK